MNATLDLPITISKLYSYNYLYSKCEEAFRVFKPQIQPKFLLGGHISEKVDLFKILQSQIFHVFTTLTVAVFHLFVSKLAQRCIELL